LSLTEEVETVMPIPTLSSTFLLVDIKQRKVDKNNSVIVKLTGIRKSYMNYLTPLQVNKRVNNLLMAENTL
jgi:hypothetical protein